MERVATIRTFFFVNAQYHDDLVPTDPDQLLDGPDAATGEL